MDGILGSWAALLREVFFFLGAVSKDWGQEYSEQDRDALCLCFIVYFTHRIHQNLGWVGLYPFRSGSVEENWEVLFQDMQITDSREEFGGKTIREVKEYLISNTMREIVETQEYDFNRLAEDFLLHFSKKESQNL